MSEQTEQSVKTIAVFVREYYETSIVREPIELNIGDYPELDGMTQDEAIDYVESNAWDMKATTDDYESLADQLNDMDIRRDKITNETQEINAIKEMF